jgi:hypothetical protein
VEAPGVESGPGNGVLARIGGVGEGVQASAGGMLVGSAVIGAGGGDDAATLARIALDRLRRGDLEAVGALLRLLARGAS